MGQAKRSFTSVIEDKTRGEQFSAKVTVVMKDTPRASLQKGKQDVADILITPVSGSLFFYVKGSWKKEEATFNVPTKQKKGSHCHFVVHDLQGNGLYIVRDEYRNDIEKRPCKISDLGSSFASQVKAALSKLAKV